MRPALPPHFYVKVWNQFPDAPGAKLHPHFQKYHGYPVFKITTLKTGDEILLVPDDRLHLFRILADQCTLADDWPMWHKDKTSNEEPNL